MGQKLNVIKMLFESWDFIMLQGDILESDYVREAVHHREEAACHNVDNYDVELQKLIGSASSHHYSVELQKMIGSASSAELRFEEVCSLFLCILMFNVF